MNGIYYYNGNDKGFYFQAHILEVLCWNIATFGFYSIWWHYKNWKLIQKNAETSIHPIIRAILHPFYGFALFDAIADTASTVRLNGLLTIRVIGALHVISALVRYGLFSFLPVYIVAILFTISSVDNVYIQYKINEINRKIDKENHNWLKVSNLILVSLLAAITIVILLSLPINIEISR
jgi:hypothetical protein